MSVSVNVNGKAINYPQTGDTNWGDEATNFAVETSAALSKVGLSTGTTVSIPGTLAVTGAATLNSTLSVTGTTSLTGNVTATNNLTVNGNTTLGNANTDTTNVQGIVNIDSGTLYVDPVNNRVGVNKTNPIKALDITGDIAISGNETVGGTLNVTGAASLSSTLAVTGNSTLTGNLSVNGNTTLGDASGDSLTINSNGVSIPNSLNIDSNTFVIDSVNDRIGIGVASPTNKLNIGGETAQFPTSVLINETGHATSKRAGIQIGSWLQMQDSNGNGTRDLAFYYTQGTPITPFQINTVGHILTGLQPRFFAKKTSSTGISANAIIQTWTEDFDTGNNFNNSTGIYTIPTTGIYLFFAYLGLNDSTTGTPRIRKNGVLQISMNGQSITGFNNFNSSMICIINCSTSDTVDFFTNVAGVVVSSTIPAYFGGMLIG